MRNTNHLGAAGFLSHMAVKDNMIGVCLSGKMYAEGNDTGMPPVFSLQPMFGTNPLSVAIPCGNEPPYVLDMSSTVVPVNRVELMREKGESIPAGWCLDSDGRPTTDPAAAKIMLPLGSAREQGAHKGFGLALVVEVLTALLSEGWAKRTDQPVTTDDTAAEDSSSRFSQDSIAHFFGAMRIELFRDPDDFKIGMDAMVAAIHRAPVAPGCERVIVPGEMEHETEAIRRREGIPLRESEVRDLRDLAERYDVPLELVER
jgi:LDH2 family malate/lactate/ureidoglycolate dehydrogenase